MKIIDLTPFIEKNIWILLLINLRKKELKNICTNMNPNEVANGIISLQIDTALLIPTEYRVVVWYAEEAS